MPKIDRPGVERQARVLRKMLPELQALDLVDTLFETPRLFSELEAITRARTAPRVEDVAARLRKQVRDGDLEPEDAAAQLEEARQNAARALVAADESRFTATRIRKVLWETFAGEVERSCFPRMQEMFGENLQGFSVAYDALPEGVISDSTALRKGKKATGYWLDCREALHTIYRLWRLADDLRATAALSAVGRFGGFDSAEYRWLAPRKLALVSTPRHNPPDAIILMSQRIEAGCGPAMLSAADVRRLALEDERQYGAEQQAQRPNRRRVAQVI